jgi:hypothetical protein
MPAIRKKIHHGISGNRPPLGRFLNALVHRRDELVGNHPADDAVHELVAGAPGQRRDSHVGVAVLPPASALLLVLALPFRHAPESLPVGHPGPGELGVHAVLAGQAAQQDLQMALAHPVNQGLAQLRVVLEVEGGVFLVELVQPGRQLVLFPALLDHHGRSGFALGEFQRGQPNRTVPP